MTELKQMKMRIGAVGIIRNLKGEVLLCKMPKNRGAYPGKWAIPGGGIEPEETMREALKREIKEEVGLEVTHIEPDSFDDDTVDKIGRDGKTERLYMIHLVFDCEAVNDTVVINDEFEEYAWVKPEKVKEYDLNDATVKTFTKKGWM
jgi:nucleoside triphosphatase